MPVPKGQRFGGRRKGTPNKATAAKAKEVAESGLTPLDYMLSLLRDEEKEEAVRFEAAKAAAPYVHAKLSSIDANMSGEVGVIVEIVRFGQSPR